MSKTVMIPFSSYSLRSLLPYTLSSSSHFFRLVFLSDKDDSLKNKLNPCIPCQTVKNLNVRMYAYSSSFMCTNQSSDLQSLIPLQTLAAIPSIDSEAAQQKLEHVRTYYELLNMTSEALLTFVTEHEHLFTPSEYINLLKVQIPGREVPLDAQDRMKEILSQ
ncbi:hypothetical protein Gotur_019553 [Gossypium turneri]